MLSSNTNPVCDPVCSSPRLVKGLVETELVQPAYNLIYMAACTGSRLRRVTAIPAYVPQQQIPVRPKRKNCRALRASNMCVVQSEGNGQRHAMPRRAERTWESSAGRHGGLVTPRLPIRSRTVLAPQYRRRHRKASSLKLDNVADVVLRKTDE